VGYTELYNLSPACRLCKCAYSSSGSTQFLPVLLSSLHFRKDCKWFVAKKILGVMGSRKQLISFPNHTKSWISVILAQFWLLTLSVKRAKMDVMCPLLTSPKQYYNRKHVSPFSKMSHKPATKLNSLMFFGFFIRLLSQVILCDPTWQATRGSSEMDFGTSVTTFYKQVP